MCPLGMTKSLRRTKARLTMSEVCICFWRRPANQIYPPGRSQGYKAGVTLAGIISVGIVAAAVIFLVKRRKARKARQQALAAPLVVGGIDADPESGTASASGDSEDSLANAKRINANKVHHI